MVLGWKAHDGVNGSEDHEGEVKQRGGNNHEDGDESWLGVRQEDEHGVRWPDVETTESDEEEEAEDVGGSDEGKTAQEKLHVRTRKSFELVMRSGSVHRFEVSSTFLAFCLYHFD